jgi:hypothetical protein
LPLFYTLDRICQRYGIAPWTLDLDDPGVRRGVRRSWIIMNMEAELAENLAKRKRPGRVRLGG